MKQFFIKHKKNMLLQALNSGSILSLFIYAILRILFYDFPMSWAEEILFFIKIVLISCLLIGTATGGCAWLHRVFRKMRLQKKPV